MWTTISEVHQIQGECWKIDWKLLWKRNRPKPYSKWVIILVQNLECRFLA